MPAQPDQSPRREAFTVAAFELIAERGFEGLRTRDVAARVGANIGTLHYYFPSKEALIAAVAEYLTAQFIAVHGPAPAEPETPLGRLRQEFSDMRYYRFEQPSLLQVSMEFRMRADRDPAVRAIVAQLGDGWQECVERFLADGIKDETFRADLDPRAAAVMIRATLWASVMFFNITPAAFDDVCRELERSVVAHGSESDRKRRHKSASRARNTLRNAARNEPVRHRRD